MSVLRSAAKLAFATADLFLPSPSGPRILIYHQVGAGLGRQMEVTVEDFEWQLDWLMENRQVVDLETAVARWDEPDSDHLVVLTFDDGYRDTYTTAFPLLKERGVPFTLYLATASIGDDDRLSWSQVAELASTGLATVGAHTHRHVDLRRASEGEINEELELSNALIEHRVGSRPLHFAYPWGFWCSPAEKAVRTLYETATLGAPVTRVRPPSGFDRFRIHRYPVQLSDGTQWFKARIEGGLVMEEHVRRVLRAYRGP